TSHGVAEQDEAFLTLGVVRVLNDSTQWITEHGDGFIDGDPVFHLACSVTRGRAPEQCPKIQTGASTISTNRHSALINRIRSIVRARDSSSRGLATTIPTARK